MLDMPLSEDAFRKLEDQVSSSTMCTAQPRLIKQLLKIKSKASSGIFFNSSRLSPLINLSLKLKVIYKNKLDSKKIPGSTWD